MKIWQGLLFLGGYFATPSALEAVGAFSAGTKSEPVPILSAKAVVQKFLHDVRAGKALENAEYYLAENLIAHQLTAEHEEVIERTRSEYVAHVRDFQRVFGDFEFEVTELIADEDRVYARWKQTGCHIAPLNKTPPSGLPVVEIASAVYRVESGKIVEYWIQIDRKGVELQLEFNSKQLKDKVHCLR
jgi:predicted ester cyclase